jgi:hypothetical protein
VSAALLIAKTISHIASMASLLSIAMLTVLLDSVGAFRIKAKSHQVGLLPQASCAGDETSRRRMTGVDYDTYSIDWNRRRSTCQVSECSTDTDMLQTCQTTCHAEVGCLALYTKMAIGNTNSCANGTRLIQTAADCQEAAAALGYTWGRTYSSNSSPRGCFTYINWGYFNVHPIGGVHRIKYPICRLPTCSSRCFHADRWNGKCQDCVSRYGWCGSGPDYCDDGNVTDCSAACSR